MHVLVTGATGFIGRALVSSLLRRGHTVTAWVRNPDRARALVGGDVALLDAADDAALARTMATVDGVINLAGEPVALTRWTTKRKASLTASRVDTTRRLVDAIADARRRPAVLVSASAIGIYGDAGDVECPENALAGTGFLAELCVAWEQEARRAEGLGVRVAIPRIGVVLGAEGGALGPMLPTFRLGLGGPIAGGRQWLSWIHLTDMIEVLLALLEDDRWSGPVNAVAPGAARNADFARALGAAVGRPAFLPVPGVALKLALGEGAQVVTASQHVVPARLMAGGFAFAHPTLDGALGEILGLVNTVDTARATDGEVKGARYQLRQSALLDAPLHEVFPFFARAENLGLITPSWTTFRILKSPPEIGVDSRIDYTIKLNGVPMRWRTRIAVWEPPAPGGTLAPGGGTTARFVDSQERGPYTLWWHEHRFEAVGNKTLMSDTVHYTLPLGPLGWIAHAVMVRGMLRRIFGFRYQAMRARFGIGGAATPAERPAAAAAA